MFFSWCFSIHYFIVHVYWIGLGTSVEPMFKVIEELPLNILEFPSDQDNIIILIFLLCMQILCYYIQDVVLFI